MYLPDVILNILITKGIIQCASVLTYLYMYKCCGPLPLNENKIVIVITRYLSLKRNSIFSRSNTETFYVSCGMFCNSLVLMGSDTCTYSESVCFIRCSTYDGQKTCRSKVSH